MAANYTLANKMAASQQHQKIDQLKSIGYTAAQTKVLAKKDISKLMKNESSIRANMNYYSFIIALLFVFIVFLMLHQLPKWESIKSRLFLLRLWN